MEALSHGRLGMAHATDNPMGTDGFEFVEFTAPDSRALGDVFESWASASSAATGRRMCCSIARATST